MSEIGDTIRFGPYDWQIIDKQDDSVLLLSKYVLEKDAYYTGFAGTTWAASTMRRYLNERFLGKFNADEIAQIQETKVVTAQNRWFKTSRGGQPTLDKVFLLSVEEVVQYFGDSGELAGRPKRHPEEDPWHQEEYAYSIIDRYSGNRTVIDINNNAAWWWLRTPGMVSTFCTRVHLKGWIYMRGVFVGRDGGIRPAMWVKI